MYKTNTMKKQLLFIICSLLMSVSSFAVKQNLDSALTEKYNGTAWGPYAKGIYTSDAECKVSPINLFFDWNTSTSAWDSSSEYFYTYDANGNTLNYFWKYGFGSGKLKSYSYVINNYSGGQKTDHVTQYWLDFLTNYRNTYRSLYHYNGQQKIDTSFEQNWDTASTSWKTNARIIYVYDGAGNNTQYLYQVYNTGTSSFDNSYKYDYVYTPFNEVDSFYYKLWNSGSSSWPDYQVTKYSYNGSNIRTGYITQSYAGGTWSNSAKADLTYDANGQQELNTYYQWNTGTWLQSYRYRYWYGCTQTVGIENVKADAWSVFPNPVMNKLQIEIPMVQGFNEFSVVNIEGKTMLQQKANVGVNIISTESLPAGIYLLNWQANVQWLTKRFVKE